MLHTPLRRALERDRVDVDFAVHRFVPGDDGDTIDDERLRSAERGALILRTFDLAMLYLQATDPHREPRIRAGIDDHLGAHRPSLRPGADRVRSRCEHTELPAEL